MTIFEKLDEFRERELTEWDINEFIESNTQNDLIKLSLLEQELERYIIKLEDEFSIEDPINKLEDCLIQAADQLEKKNFNLDSLKEKLEKEGGLSPKFYRAGISSKELKSRGTILNPKYNSESSIDVWAKFLRDTKKDIDAKNEQISDEDLYQNLIVLAIDIATEKYGGLFLYKMSVFGKYQLMRNNIRNKITELDSSNLDVIDIKNEKKIKDGRKKPHYEEMKVAAQKYLDDHRDQYEKDYDKKPSPFIKKEILPYLEKEFPGLKAYPNESYLRNDVLQWRDKSTDS